MSLERDPEFEEWFHEVFPRAVLLAQRLLGTREAAEDVAAEGFARAFARWSKLRRQPQRDGWVLRVTANLAIDATRRRRVLPAPVAQRSNDPNETTVLRLALVEALRALPRRQRDAVTLRYLSGLSEAQVAAALGVSAGTVKSHIHRGLQSLRSRLGERFLEEDYAVAD